MSSFMLPGTQIDMGSAEDLPSELRGALELEKTVNVSLATSRSGDAEAQTQVDGVDENDVIEIQLEGGLKLWQSVADTRADFANTDRSVSEQALLVPKTLTFDGMDASRSGGGYAVEAVKILKMDFAGKAGEMTALALAKHIESKLDTGFFRCTPTSEAGSPRLDLKPVKAKDIDTKKPMLVLVHGTFSSTNGSFSELAGPPFHGAKTALDVKDVWPALDAAFPAGIFALEHKTVTVDPVHNALDLVDALPKGAEVSLMSHSRGGLVAELVARAARVNMGDGAFDETDKTILTKAGRSPEELEKLSAAIADKNITVTRLIRIAGPLRGTTLASRRLDRFLSIALNTFELIPALKASPAYGLLKAFLLGFVKTKADPEKLPGLEAMMPASPLVAILNRPDVRYAGNLHVIAGDNEGNGIFRKLRNLAVDLFFQGDNDFVVNTASMSKGAARLDAPVLTDIISSEITHFSYFRTKEARDAIVAAAQSTPAEIPDGAGPDLIVEPLPQPFVLSQSRDASALPVCIFLPGVMGSHLNHKDSDGDTRWIWTNPVRIATGGLARLTYGGDGEVTAGDPMDRYYGDLARYLGRTHHVIPFAYDWRESVLTTGADALAKTVRKALDSTDKPIRFLAHSMGGLVVRALIDADLALWQEVVRRPGCRFVMLGTPNGGAFSMMHTLMGRAKAIRQLALADLVHSQRELLEIVTSMPGPAQLLPADGGGHYLKRGSWASLRNIDGGAWVVPPDATFKAARDAHRVFRQQQLDPEIVSYVAGLGDEPTPSNIRIDQTGDGKQKVTFLGTYDGDGTVTWATGIPDNIDPYYLDAVHGDMARTKSAFPAFLELLATGKTSQLSKTAPAHSRSADAATVPMPEEELQIYPEPDEVMDSFMGASDGIRGSSAATTARTEVSVVHGDLRFARHPVLVGHYKGDPINGAEGALDSCFEGHLTDVQELGLYPGEIETCEVVLHRDRSPGGALVAGLGKFGDLTPGQLRKTVNRAVLRYALSLQRRAMDQGKDPKDVAPIALTSLVIGHKGANMNVQQSVQSILEAVADANMTLQREDTPQITKLEFIEIFEDTAFKAASALHSASLNGQMKDRFTFDNRIKTADGARLRMDFGTEPDAWQRISVRRNDRDPEVLDFTVITDGAKAEFQKTAVQSEVIKRLLIESRDGTATDRTLGKLLFELMIPLGLKSFAQNDQQILLILDESTADIPWELMEDDIATFGEGLYQSTGSTDFKPLVIRTPMLRQLVTSGPSVPRASEPNVLVVGDTESGLAPLPGAQEEARMVAERLGEKEAHKVTELIPSKKGIEVLERAMLEPFKIMHFATHGIYEENEGTKPKAGLVLSDGIYLTSAELANMRYVPEFVFLNCCHVGRVGDRIAADTGAIAASLSRTLIAKGVRAVIAAGWAIDDNAAHLFAKEFYDSMLNGNAFANAVHDARSKVFNSFPDKNTWGAYQCYGNPEYRFDKDDTGRAGEGGRQQRYYSADHARKAAINIARDVRSPHRDRPALLSELDSLMEGAEPDWQSDARWCEAVGRAYAKLDVYDRAIELLEKAKQLSDSFATINSVERLEDLKVRSATYAWSRAELAAHDATGSAAKALNKAADDRKSEQRKTIDAALDYLKDLDKLTGSHGQPTKTIRRECLKGSISKRQALTARRGSSRTAAIRRMVGYYQNGMALAARDDASLLDPYATFNWLSGHVVLQEEHVEGQPYDAWFSRLEMQNQKQEKEAPNFWTSVHGAQIDILRGLLAGQKEHDAIFQRFETGFGYSWTRGGAYAQARSIREHVHFLKYMFEEVDADKRAWMTRIQVYLNDLTWPYRRTHRDEF